MSAKIENWPLPSEAPQYITKDCNVEVQPGQWVGTVSKREVHFYKVSKEHDSFRRRETLSLREAVMPNLAEEAYILDSEPKKALTHSSPLSARLKAAELNEAWKTWGDSCMGLTYIRYEVQDLERKMERLEKENRETTNEVHYALEMLQKAVQFLEECNPTNPDATNFLAQHQSLKELPL